MSHLSDQAATVTAGSEINTVIDLPLSIMSRLTLDVVGRPTVLHCSLLPLLHARTAPVRVRIPALRRVDGSWTKSFVFVVALREHPQERIRKLFPYRLPMNAAQLPLQLSAEQQEAYHAMSEADKQAYELMYTQEEWLANVHASRNIAKAISKSKQRSLKMVDSITCASKDFDAAVNQLNTTTISLDDAVRSAPESTALIIRSQPARKNLKLVSSSAQSDMDVPSNPLRLYVQSLENSNRLTPQMYAMLDRGMRFLAAKQSAPMPMISLSAQSACHPFYHIIRHNAFYNAPSLARNFQATIEQLVMEHPDELMNNLPGVAHVPAAVNARVRLPALIKTQFEHPLYGNVTAIAILWYVDKVRGESVKPNTRGQGFEHFFVHIDEDADVEYRSEFLSDADPSYKSDAAFSSEQENGGKDTKDTKDSKDIKDIKISKMTRVRN